MRNLRSLFLSQHSYCKLRILGSKGWAEMIRKVYEKVNKANFNKTINLKHMGYASRVVQILLTSNNGKKCLNAKRDLHKNLIHLLLKEPLPQ